MPKDLIIDITTGIIVLGSVFGASHLKKIANWVKEYRVGENLLRRPPLRATSIPYAQNKTAPPSARFGG